MFFSLLMDYPSNNVTLTVIPLKKYFLFNKLKALLCNQDDVTCRSILNAMF